MSKNRKDSFSGRKRFKTKDGGSPLRDKLQSRSSVEFSRDLGVNDERKRKPENDCSSCE
jgi:hypothetical protein